MTYCGYAFSKTCLSFQFPRLICKNFWQCICSSVAQAYEEFNFLEPILNYLSCCTQEHPTTDHEANKSNCSPNEEILESSNSAKSEQQASLPKRELALDLRYYMNRAPVTVSLTVTQVLSTNYRIPTN